MRRNVLRELMDNNKPSIGTHVHTLWPGMAEVIGYAGTIDYVEFTGTYAPHDLFSLENFGRAIDLFDNMSSMIKLDQQPFRYSKYSLCRCKVIRRCKRMYCSNETRHS